MPIARHREAPAGTVRASADDWGIGLYSDDERYRYWFITEADVARRPGSAVASHTGGLPVVAADTLVWVGLNPSHSDDNGRNRATLRTVLFWAERAGLSRVLGVNLYAYRHTKPSAIREGLAAGDLEGVIGGGNDEVLRHVAAHAEHALLAWGTPGGLGQRGAQVAGLFPDGQCVGRCKNGEPLHPGRKAKSLTFSDYHR